MAQHPVSVVTEKDVHHGHRDALAAFFQEHADQIVSWALLEALVGRNWQQRVSDARRQLKLNIENIPRFGPDGKRLTGDYRLRRADALGRSADLPVIHADAAIGPLFDTPGAFQR